MNPPPDDDWGPLPDDDDWGPLPDDDAIDGGSAGAADPVERGVETLQAAARELIRAARTVLDLAEEVVDDPDAVVDLFGQVTNLARGAARGAAARAAHFVEADLAHGTAGPGAAGPDDDPDDVEHIPVD